MLLPLVGVIVGLALLAYAADQFVIGAARLAVRWNIPGVVVGAVIIGFGTSAPEMVVSGLAANQGLLDVGVGNIIGSNIANLSLVLGSAAIVTPMVVTDPVPRRELPIALFGMLLFAVFVQNGLTVTEGVVLLLGMVAALSWILYSSRDEDSDLEREVGEFLDTGESVRLGVEIPRTALGLVGTVAAAQMLIVSATEIADILGLAGGFVGLTIVAIGTSLPELATTIQAARKREADLILGNLLGSNIFNSFGVGGIAAVLGPGQLEDPTLAGLATVLMIAVGLLTGLFLLTRRRLDRLEGALLLAGYVIALPFLR